MCLLIRADGNSQIGTGHVMRCLALAQAWQAEIQTEPDVSSLFVMADESPGLVTRLSAENFTVTHIQASAGSLKDAAQTIDLAHQMGARWMVVDGYHFDAAYQQAIKSAGFRLLVIDDYGHAAHYYADIVLNQNIYASESLYPSRESNTRLLLGSQYVLLRREFWPWRGWQREIPPVARKVLVTLGGSDPANVTLKVIQALQQVEIEGLEVRVVVGPANPHQATLQQAVESSSGQIQLLTEVLDMPGLMAWADVAISAGGSTCWELAFMGVPSVVLILANNQQLVAEGLARSGLAFNLGKHEEVQVIDISQCSENLLLSYKNRIRMSQQGYTLVDGRGSERVAKTTRLEKLNLRPVSEQDCELLWRWVNEPGVRQSAFQSEYIPWEEHIQWFSKKLADPCCFHYIALNDENVPVGQIRFDVEGTEAEVDISLDTTKRGLGYGSLLISLGVKYLVRQASITEIHSWVKVENRASIRAFTKAGFILQEQGLVKQQQYVHLRWENNG
ncbi:MAG: hypothetical protein Fur0044_00480 [Anaerolineae bacterium]